MKDEGFIEDEAKWEEMLASLPQKHPRRDYIDVKEFIEEMKNFQNIDWLEVERTLMR